MSGDETAIDRLMDRLQTGPGFLLFFLGLAGGPMVFVFVMPWRLVAAVVYLVAVAVGVAWLVRKPAAS